MKAFIDRFVYFNSEANRPLIRGKRAAVAVVLEETCEQTWRPVLDFFAKSLAYLEMAPAERLEEASQLGRRLAGAPR
jgi:multimeric flavodoxin WrbA